ncbi:MULTISPECIES: hypothetical protein [unclassified Agromyces]|uniref:hypothetical protein n=1 Tax=unclassified Agromyces TaxID=2639701 RepID=UPI0030142138
MGTMGESDERYRDDAEARSVGQPASADDATEATYDGRDDDHRGLVAGGPIDATGDAGGSRAGAGEVEADRARADDADPTLEMDAEPGESG